MPLTINDATPYNRSEYADKVEREKLEHAYCPSWVSPAIRDTIWENLNHFALASSTAEREVDYERLIGIVIAQGPSAYAIEWEKWWREHAHFARGETTEQAPYMATVQACRVSASAPGTVLFDSEHPHSHYIQLRINSAYLVRNLSHDWVHSDKELVEVSMTEAQWAACITSLNHGSGVACTIDHILHQEPPVKPSLPEDRTSLFSGELNSTQKTLVSQLDELMEVDNGK